MISAESSLRIPAHRFTVSNQLATVVAVGASLGFLVVIAFQIAHARSLLTESELLRNTYRTELLAAQLYGEVRWRRLESLAQVTADLAARNGNDVAAIVILERSGAELSSFHAPAEEPIDLFGIVQANLHETAAGEVFTTRQQGRFVVVAPVVSQELQDRAGTFAIAWNLDGINSATQATAASQGAVALATIAIFVGTALYVVSRRLGRPLADITTATDRIASGDKTFEVPWTDRRDEIGDMARALVTFRQNVALIDRLTADQQQQTMRLAAALEKEREYNALHREFVSMVSHEFRTPVAIIDGAAQRIERRAGKDTPETLLQRTEKIRGAVRRMIDLIDSTLSASRIESGTIELELVDCDLATLMQEIVRRQQDICATHQINLTLGELPKSVRLDPQRIDQVLTNLLSNAVKYSPDSPHIEVKAAAVGDRLSISIEDQGLGVPERDVPKLFERFFRASTSTGIPGTGIGLYLVKHLVELHGGTIKVDSVEGLGSTFSVELPLRATQPEKEWL